MKKLILICLLATGLFADECSWNINKSTEEIKKLSISMNEKDYISAKYHNDMALIYNMNAIVICNPSITDVLKKHRSQMIENKNWLKDMGY